MRSSFTAVQLYADFASRLVAAQRDRRGIDVPQGLPEPALADAYAVQDALVAAREASGARRAGWKLGITSPVKQRVPA